MPPSPATKKRKSERQITEKTHAFKTNVKVKDATPTEDEHPATSLFREYIRIKSVQPNPDYESCIIFLEKQAKRLGLSYHVTEIVKGKPIFIMTWPGLEPDLPSLLLNSHTDVVPVYEDQWKHDPFAAVKEENGDIYGRGTQDMKSVGIQHIEAIYRLKVEQKKRFKRTIHLCFIADEELGGHDGMKQYVVSKEFKKLNIGLALDEGLASPTEVMPVYYGERNVFWVRFHCTGKPGHGSRFIENTAAEKVQFLINKLLGYREEQKKKFEADPNSTLGDVTTVNLTTMSGGVQQNVVPNEFVIGFDIRITPTTNLKEFEDMIRKWCDEAGGGIELEFKQKFTDQTMTPISLDDPWFKAFKTAIDKNGLKVATEIFPAATDSRFIREIGIPAFGFSPMPNTPILLHDHNEFLNENIFLKGIDIFCDVIGEIAQV